MHIGSGVDYAVFIAVTRQNVGDGELLGVRDGDSGSDGEDIYGSGCGGKGCVSGREDICAAAARVVARVTPLEGCLARLVTRGWRGEVSDMKTAAYASILRPLTLSNALSLPLSCRRRPFRTVAPVGADLKKHVSEPL